MPAKKRRLVLVRWIDTASETGWARPGERGAYSHMRGLRCESVGYVVRRTAKVIAIAQSIEEQGKVNDVITIPIPCVRQVRRLVHK